MFNPDNVEVLLCRAQLYEAVKKLDEAQMDYKKVLEIDPENDSANIACMVRVKLIVYIRIKSDLRDGSYANILPRQRVWQGCRRRGQQGERVTLPTFESGPTCAPTF